MPGALQNDAETSEEEEDPERAGPGRCYRWIGSQLGTYIHAPLNNSEAMISKLQITRRLTTKPAMGAPSSLPWFLLRPVSTFSSSSLPSYPLGSVHLLRAFLAVLGCRGIVSSSFFSLASSLPNLSRPSESSHRFIRGPSAEIIITIMIKAGITCCVRGNIGRGPRGMGNGSMKRDCEGKVVHLPPGSHRLFPLPLLLARLTISLFAESSTVDVSTIGQGHMKTALRGTNARRNAN